MAAIGSFAASSNFKPNSVKLDWAISGSLGANEEIQIRRALTTYPQDIADGTLVYSTTNVTDNSFEDNGLEDNTYYYYTAFIYDTVAQTFQDVFTINQVYGFSYKNWGSGELVYSLFPQETRSLDLETGRELYRLSLTIGNMIDLYRSEVFAMEYNRKPQDASANILPLFSEGFGFPAERALDLNVLRRIAQGIVSVYKKKGTAEGIVDFIKLFVEFDSTVLEDVDPNFKLYDESSKLERGTLTAVAAQQAIDSTKSFGLNDFVNGTFIDAEFDNLYSITGNTATTINFAEKTPPSIKSESGNGIGLDDSISDTADNNAAYTGTVLSGDNDSLIDSGLSVYPDNYWNQSILIMTSGANQGHRRRIKNFDVDTNQIVLDTEFDSFVSPGDTYSITRNRHITVSSLSGLDQNELAGRDIEIIAGTNSGLSCKIARNYEFGGNTEIVLSRDFTVPCDSTSQFTIESTGLKFQDSSQSWTLNEWQGYKLTVNGLDFNIVSNDSDTLTVSPLQVNLDSPESLQFYSLTDRVSVSTAYTVENQYTVYEGPHAFLFQDTIPFEFRNTFRDLASFLVGGTSRSIFTVGSFTELELPIVITGEIDTSGRSTNLSVDLVNNTSTLTDTSKNFTADEFVGKRLNPNFQQDFDFEIISNTSDSITVNGNLTLVSIIGNNYYVIDEEGSIKTRRVRSVLPEFVPHYLNPIVFHEEG